MNPILLLTVVDWPEKMTPGRPQKIDIRRPKYQSELAKWLHAQDSFPAKDAVGKGAGNSVFWNEKNHAATYRYSRNSNPVSPTIISAAYKSLKCSLKLADWIVSQCVV
jgi:hypothetical protein